MKFGALIRQNVDSDIKCIINNIKFCISIDDLNLLIYLSIYYHISILLLNINLKSVEIKNKHQY